MENRDSGGRTFTGVIMFSGLLSRRKLVKDVNFHVTLWPAFPHFGRFAKDARLAGIRLNSAMMLASEIDDEFEIRVQRATVPLWFDVKGMQLRIREVVCDHNCDHLEFILNRPVKTKVPFVVDFKAGEDAAQCVEIRDGTHFIFRGGPKNEVRAGESIHIRQNHEVGGPVFLDYEIEKIKKISDLGFTNWYLSYVWDQKHVDEFRELIGQDAQVRLKIENVAGLSWVERAWKPQPNTNLVAARGDLYVEVEYPHEVLNACRLIISKDPDAMVGSRMLLSLVKSHVPSCADFSDLAWLHDIGFRNFLLCDELCLKPEMLSPCVTILDEFRKNYCKAMS